MLSLSAVLAAPVSVGGNALVAPSVGLILWTVLVVGIWLTFAVLIGRAAARRGQSPVLLFLTSLVFSPLVGLVVLVAFGHRTQAESG